MTGLRYALRHLTLRDWVQIVSIPLLLTVGSYNIISLIQDGRGLSPSFLVAQAVFIVGALGTPLVVLWRFVRRGPERTREAVGRIAFHLERPALHADPPVEALLVDVWGRHRNRILDEVLDSEPRSALRYLAEHPDAGVELSRERIAALLVSSDPEVRRLTLAVIPAVLPPDAFPFPGGQPPRVP